MNQIVFVVDDDSSVRKALTRVLETHGLDTAECASAEDFLERFDDTQPGCVVLDVAMPGLSGFELQQALIERSAMTPIVFLTGHGDIRSGVAAMKEGAVDFLTKPVVADELLLAVRDALRRDRVARNEVIERRDIENRFATLTVREREVLPHVLAGHLGKQIAGELGIVEKTVKVHRYRIMHKLGTRSVAQLVWLAGRVGIRPSPP